MGISIQKTGNIISSIASCNNIYSGTQHNCANAKITYNFETNVFQNLGFPTALKLEPTQSDDGKTKFITYSYLLTPTLLTDTTAEYCFSMYGYCSEDCNANMRIHLEHTNIWTTNYLHTAENTNDSTKGKVVWIWGKFRPNQTDGKVYIMFYPNPNQIDVFTHGYQLFTGITIYKGTSILRPSSNNTNHGFYTIPGNVYIKDTYLESEDIWEI